MGAASRALRNIAGERGFNEHAAGESDLCDRDLTVTRFATRRMENSNPVPGTVAAKRLETLSNLQLTASEFNWKKGVLTGYELRSAKRRFCPV